MEGSTLYLHLKQIKIKIKKKKNIWDDGGHFHNHVIELSDILIFQISPTSHKATSHDVIWPSTIVRKVKEGLGLGWLTPGEMDTQAGSVGKPGGEAQVIRARSVPPKGHFATTSSFLDRIWMPGKRLSEVRTSLGPFWLALSTRQLAKERRKEPKWPKYYSPKISLKSGQKQTEAPKDPAVMGSPWAQRPRGEFLPLVPQGCREAVALRIAEILCRQQSWVHSRLRPRGAQIWVRGKWWQLQEPTV